MQGPASTFRAVCENVKLRFNLLLCCAELVLGIRQLYLGLRDI